MRRYLATILAIIFSLLQAGICLAGIDPHSGIDIADLGKPAFRAFTIKDGLPQNTVQTIAVDSKNYIWVGTQDGAAFYNGRRWNVVNMPNRSVTNDIRSMLVTSDGSIWFGTVSGGLA